MVPYKWGRSLYPRTPNKKLFKAKDGIHPALGSVDELLKPILADWIARCWAIDLTGTFESQTKRPFLGPWPSGHRYSMIIKDVSKSLPFPTPPLTRKHANTTPYTLTNKLIWRLKSLGEAGGGTSGEMWMQERGGRG